MRSVTKTCFTVGRAPARRSIPNYLPYPGENDKPGPTVAKGCPCISGGTEARSGRISVNRVCLAAWRKRRVRACRLKGDCKPGNWLGGVSSGVRASISATRKGEQAPWSVYRGARNWVEAQTTAGKLYPRREDSREPSVDKPPALARARSGRTRIRGLEAAIPRRKQQFVHGKRTPRDASNVRLTGHNDPPP